MSGEKPFIAINHGKGQVDLRKWKGIRKMRPVEIHLKEDGSIKAEPTFTIVMSDFYTVSCFGEISLEMLNNGLADIGYEIVKKKK